MADVTTTFAAKDESFATTVDNLQRRLSGLETDVKGFNERVSSLARGFGDFLAPLAAAAAAFLGLKSAVDTFFTAVDQAGKLNDLSARTGESVGNLAILQRAFQNAGSSAEAVGPMINKLQMSILEAADPSSKTAQAFSDLGIGLDELRGKSPLEMFQMLGPAIAAIEDPLKRTEIARALFAKGGGELIPLLRAMGIEIDTARAQLGAYPEALNKAASALDTVGDNFTAIKNKGVEFATGLLVNVAPSLAEVTSKIAEIDAARLGMILSGHLQSFLQAADGALGFSRNLQSVKTAIDAMASGNIGAGFELLFSTAKIQAMQFLNEFVRLFQSSLQTIGGFFADFFSSDGAIVRLIGTTFEFVGKKIESSLSAAFSSVMSAIPIIGEDAARSLNLISQAAEVEAQAVKWHMGQAAGDVAKEFFKAGAAMPQAFAENYSKIKDPLFDLTAETAKRDQLENQINNTLAAQSESVQKISTEAANASQNAALFKENIANAKADVQGAVDLTTGPGGIAAATKEAANATQQASGSLSDAFKSVTQSGPALEKALDAAANNFGKITIASGREFAQEVRAGFYKLFDGDGRFATEATLQRVVSELQTLNTKLPQPALTA